MELKLKKNNDGEIELLGFGLKLLVKPKFLIQTMMNENSQMMLDHMIEKKYRQVIQEFDHWYNNDVNASDDEIDSLGQ